MSDQSFGIYGPFGVLIATAAGVSVRKGSEGNSPTRRAAKATPRTRNIGKALFGAVDRLVAYANFAPSRTTTAK